MLRSLLLLSLVLALPTMAQTQPETPDQHNARMSWWREARFGMFIHWGIYSVPAKGEWYMYNAKVPVAEYEKYAPQFNPVKFNALAWVKLAKAAGMKYIVITTKHHDGFSMWDSKVSDYTIMKRTPYHHDVMKELEAACKQEGIRLCFYHSILDWHHPDANGDRFPTYREKYLKPQLKELLTNYGPIGVLWFDGDWIPEWTEQEGQDLYRYVRSLQSNIIINNRVGKGRGGSMAGMSTYEAAGDFGTPEQEIPATGMPGVDWESCMTMNDDWGFNAKDTNWKSTETLVRDLVDIASKGGNFLLNVGPTSLGLIPEPSVERLQEMGKWMDVNSESIYGTTASPFTTTPWGRCTQKLLPSGATRLYLHIFQWPADGKLVVAGLGTMPQNAVLLAAAKNALPISTAGDSAIITLPAASPSAIDAVVALDFPSKLIVFRPPTIQADPTIFLDSTAVTITAPDPVYAIHYTTDGSEPTLHSPVYGAPVHLTASSTVRARSFFHDKPVSSEVSATFTKVAPHEAVAASSSQPGLAYAYFEGNWDALPDFSKLAPVATGSTATLNLNMKKKAEYFGVRFHGYIDVPATAIYRCILSSDDGSRLLIDGTTVADNDGLHGTTDKAGYCPLMKGKHTIEVLYFNKTGDAVLGLQIAGGKEQLNQLSEEALSH